MRDFFGWRETLLDSTHKLSTVAVVFCRPGTYIGYSLNYIPLATWEVARQNLSLFGGCKFFGLVLVCKASSTLDSTIIVTPSSCCLSQGQD